MPLKIKLLKKKKRVPFADIFCRNCGVRTIGCYCHKCGQNISAGMEESVFELVAQFFNKAFAFDGRTPITLSNLMWRPGFLSKEYRAGRIVRYVHPVKLFWFATLIFFALMVAFINYHDSVANTIRINNNSATEKIAAAENLPVAETDLAETENSENSKPNKTIVGGNDFTTEQLLGYFTKYGPFVAFLLIPIFALLLASFFWRNKFFYMHHLVFALHFHTFLWVFFCLLLVVNILFPNVKYSDWVGLLLFLTPGVYLSIAARRYYQKTRWNAIWKASVITFVYFFLVLIVTALLIVLVLKIHQLW
jgi:hypothetical protein